MSDIQFVEVDSQNIINQVIANFEAATGETLNPTDERRIFLMNLIPVVVGLKNDINQSAKQNLLQYATGSMLDALGDLRNCPRLPAQKAMVTLRFTLSAVQATPLLIPGGSLVTPDGVVYFATTGNLTIIAGQVIGDIIGTSVEAGIKYNGFAPGQIKNIVNPIPYVSSVSNIDTSSWGAEIEPDDDGVNVWSGYRERIREAPEGYSTAGPEGAYKFWAKTADQNIVDVYVNSPSAGTVNVVPLLKGGLIPSQGILDKVIAAVNSKTIRPLTDNVTVSAPTQTIYNITFTYYIASDRKAEELTIKAAIEALGGAIEQYNTWQCSKLGRSINPDILRQLVMNAGASRIVLTTPVYTALGVTSVGKLGTAAITYGGFE